MILLTAGMAVYMLLVPYAEAAEQTILQKVVPYRAARPGLRIRPKCGAGRVAADGVPDWADHAARSSSRS